MKRQCILGLIIVALITTLLVGCDERTADDVSYNLSLEADNFNCVRQLTVINCMTDTVLYQMTGRMSIEVDTSADQLEIVVKMGEDSYKKDFVDLNECITYTVIDVTNTVVEDNYTINFNPDLWFPTIDTIN
jgi:hypothetical protein